MATIFLLVDYSFWLLELVKNVAMVENCPSCSLVRGTTCL